MPGLDVVVVNYTELAWAAGFFDGEGNTHTEKRRDRSSRPIRMSISQCDMGPLDRFNAAIGGVGKVYGPYARTGREIWTLTVFGIESVAKVLASLRPYLCDPKIVQAEKAISDYWAAHTPRVKAKHGTYSMYSNQKCRCEPCVEAGRAYHREWSRRRKVG